MLKESSGDSYWLQFERANKVGETEVRGWHILIYMAVYYESWIVQRLGKQQGCRPAGPCTNHTSQQPTLSVAEKDIGIGITLAFVNRQAVHMQLDALPNASPQRHWPIELHGGPQAPVVANRKRLFNLPHLKFILLALKNKKNKIAPIYFRYQSKRYDYDTPPIHPIKYIRRIMIVLSPH